MGHFDTNETINVMPEFEDAKATAQQIDVPLKQFHSALVGQSYEFYGSTQDSRSNQPIDSQE